MKWFLTPFLIQNQKQRKNCLSLLTQTLIITGKKLLLNNWAFHHVRWRQSPSFKNQAQLQTWFKDLKQKHLAHNSKTSLTLYATVTKIKKNQVKLREQVKMEEVC